MSMVITHLWGGLGNQMFQFAAGRALASRCGATLKLDISALPGAGRSYALGPLAIEADAVTVADLDRLDDNPHGGDRRFAAVKRSLPFLDVLSPAFFSDPQPMLRECRRQHWMARSHVAAGARTRRSGCPFCSERRHRLAVERGNPHALAPHHRTIAERLGQRIGDRRRATLLEIDHIS